MSHFHETSFVYENPAWHQLSKVIKKSLKVAEALIESGLDWLAEEKPISVLGFNQEIPGFKAIVRSTDKKVLGIVKSRYKPKQNIDAFQWFDSFISSKVARFESAGSLKEGKIVWILAKINNLSADVLKNDQVDTYLLLVNSHDGSIRITFKFTIIRVVCWNTLSMSLADNFPMVQIKHTKNADVAMEGVKETINISKKTFEVSLEAFKAMAKKKIDIIGLKNYVISTIGEKGSQAKKDDEEIAFNASMNLADKEPEFTDEEIDKKLPRCFEEIETIFDGGAGSQYHKGTVWGAYNAVTDWIDHRRSRDADEALYCSWLGIGTDIRQKAFDNAVALIK